MRLRGIVYRAHHPRWAFAPDSGEGARRHGGRFNPVGVPALYAARRLETAWLEAQGGFAFKAQPMTMCAYEVDCADVLDLTDATTRAAEGVAPGDLSCAWEDIADRGGEPPSWALARRLIAAGHAGIVVPSFAAGAGEADANVVFWRWSAEPPHIVRVVDHHGRLPRDDRSWRGDEPAAGEGNAAGVWSPVGGTGQRAGLPRATRSPQWRSTASKSRSAWSSGSPAPMQ